MNITIAGAGYVGLVTGVCLSHRGRNITIMDVDEDKICMLGESKSPIFEKDLDTLLKECQSKMSFTSAPEKAYSDADAVMIAVATPDRRDGSANLEYLYQVCNQILSYSRNGCLVIVKSTAPVGTCDKIQQFFDDNRNGLFKVAANPEFLAQGTAVQDTLHPARIVIGANEEPVAAAVRKIYEGFDSKFILTDSRSAEMIKYASNDFLALKISYINEIANLCEIVGADAETVALGMGLDPRIGSQYLAPGTGYGGSCFPKDTKALHWLARYHDYELKTIKATIEVNENQKIRLMKKSRKYYKSLKNLTAAVLGLAFKPGTDDLREAPALDMIQLLSEAGAVIRAWDPTALHKFESQHSNIVIPCKTIEEALWSADICFIMTEWDEIKAYPPGHYASFMRRPIVIDGRNCYPAKAFAGTGVLYDSIGRSTVNEDIIKKT